MTGNAIIIVILFAIGFQVIRIHIKMDKKFKEISERLRNIEDKLNQKPT